MKKITTTVLATALVTAIAMPAFVTGASAQGPRNAGAMNADMLTSFACSESAATRIERGLGRISERLQLTNEQTPAFDAFKSSALAAQSEFLLQCEQFKEARDEAGQDIDLIDRMNNRQAMLGARLSAVASVMPQLEIFYDNLSDEQKLKLRPRPHRPNRGPNQGPNNAMNKPA